MFLYETEKRKKSNFKSSAYRIRNHPTPPTHQVLKNILSLVKVEEEKEEDRYDQLGCKSQVKKILQCNTNMPRAGHLRTQKHHGQLEKYFLYKGKGF
jgi:hypothetical protein